MEDSKIKLIFQTQHAATKSIQDADWRRFPLIYDLGKSAKISVQKTARE
jgi:hypothetical protein